MRTSIRQSSTKSRTILLVPCLLGLAASATGAAHTEVMRPAAELAAPASWTGGATSKAEGTLTADWWKQFKDPVLDSLVAAALDGSPDIRTAVSRIEQARAVRVQTRAGLLPSLSVGGSGSASRKETKSTGVVSSGDSYASALDASWEVDLFGRQAKQLSAADADLARLAETLRDARTSLAAEVASTYTTLRANEQKLQIEGESLALREQLHVVATQREQSGSAGALDTLQSTTGLEQLRASVPALEAEVRAGRNALALLAGKAPGALDAMLGNGGEIPSSPSALALGIPADTLRQRPDLRAAEQAFVAASARTSSARRQRYPSLRLSGSFGVDSLVAERLFRPESTVLALVGSLSAPLFDAGKIRAQIAAAGEEEKQAFLAWEKAVLTALSEVENALVLVRADTVKLGHLEKAEASAREAAALAALQYQAGLVDFTTVLETQRTELAAREQAVSARAAHVTDHVRLFKALGGAWSTR